METAGCAHCGGANPALARFCHRCGRVLVSASVPLTGDREGPPGPTSPAAAPPEVVSVAGTETSVCPGCGTANRYEARFCRACGGAIGPTAPPIEVAPADRGRSSRRRAVGAVVAFAVLTASATSVALTSPLGRHEPPSANLHLSAGRMAP